MPTRQGGSALKNSSTWRRRSCFLNNSFGGVNAVNLKYVLGDIQTDRRNLHVESSLMQFVDNDPPIGISLPGAGAIHSIRIC